MKNGNFGYLFIGLLVILLGLPFTEHLAGGRRYSLTLLFCLFMLISIWSLASSKRIFQLGLLLVIAIASVAGIGFWLGPSEALEIIGLGLMLVFCSLSCLIAARNVFVWHQVDLNALIGAFCVYVLQGLIWALLYRMLYSFDWVSFTGNLSVQSKNLFSDLTYFSFVTLASLGYGDIAPVSSLTKTLAYLEVLIGQFYLAIMVASLVGVYSAGRWRGGKH